MRLCHFSARVGSRLASLGDSLLRQRCRPSYARIRYATEADGERRAERADFTARLCRTVALYRARASIAESILIARIYYDTDMRHFYS